MGTKPTKARPQVAPFHLPKAIAGSLRRHTKAAAEGKEEVSTPLKYVWIYLCETHCARGGGEPAPARMTLEDWLNVVDESAALGAESIFISVETRLSEWPELWKIAHWAQETHDMLVAICVNESCLSDDQLHELTQLDHDKTRIYVTRDNLESMRYIERFGYKVYVGEVLEVGAVQKACSMPESMLCIGPEGAMYTCGLVLNDDHYLLGHACSQQFESVMGDHSLPHIIPEGIAVTERRCHACPPLMEKRLEEQSGA
ncbi:MAG: hypothetical protein HZB26_24455 [Candidatus Hydrogenedentes bacterium]|nr:hypothetical protein [Candidatus Hydrogenedentota bacterium]